MRRRKIKMPLAVLVLLAQVCLGVACQPTPEHGIVQSKQDGDMLDIVRQSRDPSRELRIPGSAQDSAVSADGAASVRVQAVVETADSGAYPVYTVKPSDITDEEADRIIHALIGDNPLWAADWGCAVFTKEYLDNLIISTKKTLAGATDPGAIEELRHMIDYFEKEYQYAPESRYEEPAITSFSNIVAKQFLRSLEFSWNQTGTIYGEAGTEEEYLKEKEGLLQSIKEGDNLSIEGIVDLEGDEEAFIEIRKNSSNKNNSVKYRRYNYKEEMLRDYGLSASKKPDVTISREEAFQLAQETIRSMGIDYMALVELDYSDYPNDAHRFMFVREISGVLPTYTVPEDATGGQFRESWRQEFLSVAVNDGGIERLEWHSPTDLVEELNADVVLLPFEDMMDIFREMILVKVVYNGDSEEEYITKREYVIDRIVLGSMVVAQPNNQNEYLVIPVWDFFGYEIDTYSQDYPTGGGYYRLDENHQRKIEDPYHSYLTVNAIDGTIIDRAAGY